MKAQKTFLAMMAEERNNLVKAISNEEQVKEKAVAIATQDKGVQKFCFDFEQKYQRHLRRPKTQLQVELGYEVSENCIKVYCKELDSSDSDGNVSRVYGHIKKASFGAGSKYSTCANPKEPGLFASELGVKNTKAVTITITSRKKDYEFELACEDPKGSRVETITLEAPKKELRLMNDLFPGINPRVEHGSYVNETSETWNSPICVVECDQDARPGYRTRAAHEFEDDPRTLRLKVKAMAALLKASKNTVAYTGAGISTAAGIDDYASKAGKNSQIQKGRKKCRSMKNALPTIGHRSLVELWRRGKLQNWVQQNHDGLPQKAGFPQECINEIHGGWFDPSNPVVPMKGSLRSDLTEWLEKAGEAADLCMAIGTSMVGMTADGLFEDICDEYNDKGNGLGGIIIALQQTQYDKKCRLRIYSRIDEVLSLLMEEMNFIVPPCGPYKPSIPKEAIVSQLCYKVPYNRYGKLTKDKSRMIVWDLNPGTKHRLTDGPGEGFEGTIRNIENGHFKVVLPIQRQKSPEFGTGSRAYTLGSFWIETAVRGGWPKLPMVNIDAKLQSNLPK